MRSVGYNKRLALECSSYADEKVRIFFDEELQQRSAALEAYKRLARRLRAIHDKIRQLALLGESTDFMEARAEQVFVQKTQAEDVLNELEMFLQEHWDRFFRECYHRLRVIHGGRG